jgi:uncharacterized membrane protein
VLYYWWVPVAAIYYMIYAWISVKAKVEPDFGVWHYSLLIFMFCPLWFFVVKQTKDILFDGMLYDNTLFLAFSLTFVALGQGNNFSQVQWLGVLIVILGSILMRT